MSSTEPTPRPIGSLSARRGASRSRNRWRSEDGQALVEFALILPVVAIILLGIAHFGLALNSRIDETHIVSEGARRAEVNAICGTKAIIIKATLAIGSKTLTVTEGFANVAPGMEVSDASSGGSIPSGTTVVKIISGEAKTWEMSKGATRNIPVPEAVEAFPLSAHTCEPGAPEPAEREAFLHWLRRQGDNTAVKEAAATICSPTSKPGDYVEVKLTYKYKWLPIFELEVAESDVMSTARMRIEKEPSTPYPTVC